MNVSPKSATAGTASKIIQLLLMLVLVAAPLNAQRGRQPAPKAPPPRPVAAAQPAPTFETLLAADSYKIYGEVRGVGQLLRSGGINDILDPLVKLAAPPKEFKTLVKWLNTHADALITSRLMVATWPSRMNLPSALFVIEFDSAEEAQKFEPQLKEFLPKFLPTPAPEASPSASADKENKNVNSNAKIESPEAKPKAIPPTGPQFVVKQSGSLVFVSLTPFTLKTLRPPGSKLLAEDPNFRQVHNRFSSESVFLYFDVTAIEKEEQDRMRQMEENEKKRLESEAANPKKAEEEEQAEPNKDEPVLMPEGPSPEPIGVAPPPPAPGTLSGSPQVVVDVGTSGVLVQGEPQHIPPTLTALSMLSGFFFTGQPKWPDGIGVSIAFDADSYVVRALLVNSPGVKGSAIPFIPQLISGPALTPEASSILPADTEMLVTLSLDYPQMYEGMAKTMTREPERGRRGTRQTIRDNQPESPFAEYEARLGIKIKEDLLPLLGNEIAISVPVKAFGLSAPQPSPASSPTPSSSPGLRAEDGSADKPTSPTEPAPVIAISVKDREALRILIPKIIDSLGFKGASMLAQTEKRDDTELVSYAGVISYAFIGNFLIGSPDAKSVRHVVDSYLKHQTLASDSSFKNYTRWQPRQLLGQVYISPALMGSYDEFAKQVNATANDKLRDFLSRLSPNPEPVTYALSNEGLGPLHELHVPKNLVMFMIAGIASESNQPPIVRNEAIAESALRMLSSAQVTYQSTAGNGNYGTLDQLIEQGLVHKDLLQNYGYKIEVTVVGAKFEATAVPLEYDKTGRRSFLIDESGVLRGADHGGGMATVADTPVP